MHGGMTSQAYSFVVLDCLLAAQRLMGIMASSASHLASAKTSGFTQAVSGVRNFKAIVPVGVAVIEINRVVPKRLSRPIRKRVSIVSAN